MATSKTQGTTEHEERGLTNILLNLIEEIERGSQKEIEQKEIKEKIEESAASFVDESITALNKRERNLKTQALIWYVLGFLSLIAGIVVAGLAINVKLSEKGQVIEVIYLMLKSLFVIGLLVAASRYAFNLGKMYTNESLKNADRIHAISFGKFYLQVFGTNVKPDELKEVFKDWNTSKESPFTKLESGEFDPELLKSFLKFTEIMNSLEKKVKS